jgi:hypothetical protein
VINYDTFDFSKSAIIKPIVENFDDSHRIPTKKMNLIIASNDRDRSTYKTPADYVCSFFEDIQDVLSVELKIASLPFNPYNINSTNNILVLSDGNQDYSMTISSGIYTGATLAAALTASYINTIPGFFVTFNSTSQHLEFSASVPFTIVGPSDASSYIPGGLLKNLGFGPMSQTSQQDTASGLYRMESEYVVNLIPANTIVMNIDTMNVKLSNNNVFNKAYGILAQNQKDTMASDTYTIKKHFNPPMPRIDKLHIRFTDINGNPYDFQNIDHFLEFSFESHTNIRKYHTYLT